MEPVLWVLWEPTNSSSRQVNPPRDPLTSVLFGVYSLRSLGSIYVRVDYLGVNSPHHHFRVHPPQGVPPVSGSTHLGVHYLGGPPTSRSTHLGVHPLRSTHLGVHPPRGSPTSGSTHLGVHHLRVYDLGVYHLGWTRVPERET